MAEDIQSNFNRDNFRTVFEKQQIKSLELRNEPITARRNRLKKLRDWILSNESRIQEAVQQDLRKPAVEVQLSEIRPCIAEIRKVLSNLDLWAGTHYVDTPISYLGTSGSIRYEPKGVTLIIAPWNFPFNLMVTPLISSLAAGNTAILKPSERTPSTSGLIKNMVEELFAAEEVAVFIGGPEVSIELTHLPFDHIFFTGSSRVGKEIMKAAAENLAGLTLELGGKTPTIVDSSANLEDAAEKIAWGKFLNCGQTCIAPDYVLIESSVKDVFLNKLKEQVHSLFGGEEKSIESSPDYGRLVDVTHLERMHSFLDDAKENGATVLLGGGFNEDNLYMEPTIIENVAIESKLMEEEIFGPILPVLPFDSLKDAIDRINSMPKPLALYVFSSKKNNINEVSKATSSGTFVLNDCVLQYSHPDLPFGGINDSGFGKSHGFYGFKQFSNEKPILSQRTGFTAVKMLYPPYRGFVKWWANFVSRYL